LLVESYRAEQLSDFADFGAASSNRSSFD
jgi:hypothetical protein